MTIRPRDPYSAFVDRDGRVQPDWYSWMEELSRLASPAVTTVSQLPPASVVGAGTRGFVTDATATTFFSVVAGGGSNKVPVVSDGAAWRIG